QYFTAQRVDVTPVFAMDLLQDLDRERNAKVIIDDLVDIGDAAAADEPPAYKTFGGRRDFARRGFGCGWNVHAGDRLKGTVSNSCRWPEPRPRPCNSRRR